MITEKIKSFVEKSGHGYIASSDATGAPHLAAGRNLGSPDPGRLVFEAWFCATTLRNVRENPQVAIAVADPVTGEGYQFLGRVEQVEDTAILDGFLDQEPPGMPQVQERLSVQVESVMEFSAGAHSDQPIG